MDDRIVAGAGGDRTADGGARLAEAVRLVRRLRPGRHRRGSSRRSASARDARSRPLASVAEIVGGLLVALGLLGPVGPALMLVGDDRRRR